MRKVRTVDRGAVPSQLAGIQSPLNEILSEITDPRHLATLGHLAVGLILSLLVKWHYARFGASLSNREEFSRIFPLVTLAVIVVITVVKTSLALSLGLIGALSIVRFRTPIKEPEELTYLFLCIAVGIGLGADAVSFTVLSTAFILLSMAVLGFLRGGFLRGGVRGGHGGKSQNLHVSLQSKQPGDDFNVETVAGVIAAEFPVCEIRRVDRSPSGTHASFHVAASEAGQMFRLMEKFQQDFPELELSIVEQQRVPGV